MTAARLSAVGFAFLLASCAMVPPAPTPLPQLTAVPAAFEMSGRLAVRQGQASEIARLRWSHRPGGDSWTFASPLGNEVARIESGPQGAVLTTGSAPAETAPSFAALSERMIGVPLDPATLATWLHGQAGAAPDGWSVVIEETQAAGAVQLARRLVATRGDTTVRLVVDEYRVLPE